MEAMIKQASKLLEEGKIVSFPTETVFALAANAQNKKALDTIFKVKGREYKKPLALLVENIEEAKNYVSFNENALRIAKRFCPGPISFVLPESKNANLPDVINGGMSTLSVRIPDHPVALSILKNTNCPIVATSANISGMPDSLSASDVRGYFDNKIDMVVDGEGCSGKASTIIDLCTEQPRLLRQGEITIEEILKIIEN